MVNPPDLPNQRPAPQEGNGQAIASMVLGILSFVACGPIFSVPAIILGKIALDKIRRGVMSPDSQSFAKAGTILGWINLALFVAGFALFVLFFVVSASGAGRVSPFIYKP
jgi:hypothetical protein